MKVSTHHIRQRANTDTNTTPLKRRNGSTSDWLIYTWKHKKTIDWSQWSDSKYHHHHHHHHLKLFNSFDSPFETIEFLNIPFKLDLLGILLVLSFSIGSQIMHLWPSISRPFIYFKAFTASIGVRKRTKAYPYVVSEHTETKVIWRLRERGGYKIAPFYVLNTDDCTLDILVE
jgi:hypothetical protein